MDVLFRISTRSNVPVLFVDGINPTTNTIPVTNMSATKTVSTLEAAAFRRHVATFVRFAQEHNWMSIDTSTILPKDLISIIGSYFCNDRTCFVVSA